LGGGGKFGKKFDHCLRAQIGSGIGGRIKNEWEANGFGAEWACQFECDAWVGGSGVGLKMGLLYGAGCVAVDDELNVRTGKGEEARAIGSRGANFGVKRGREKLACGRTFDGQAGAIEENLVSGWGAAGKVERTFESAGTTKEGTCEKNDNSCVGNHESDVVALPRPSGKGRADEVKAKKNEPQVEPRGSVHVRAGNAGAEPRF
jgi:hypothetical protein